MKFSNKFFIVLGLVALLASLFVTTAFAADTRVVRLADVTKIRLLDDQPATFRMLGSYTCDKVQINSSVSGKTISIYAYDVKVRYTGHGCDTSKGYRKEFSIGTLVPGTYTVLINPDSSGKPQKKFTFIAPVLPGATPAPAK